MSLGPAELGLKAGSQPQVAYGGTGGASGHLEALLEDAALVPGSYALGSSLFSLSFLL